MASEGDEKVDGGAAFTEVPFIFQRWLFFSHSLTELGFAGGPVLVGEVCASSVSFTSQGLMFDMWRLAS